MLVSYLELCDFAASAVIYPVKTDSINGTSIDVHLGHIIKSEDPAHRVVSLRDKENVGWTPHDITDAHYDLAPGEFVLAHTVEKFDLPANISAEFKLNSSGARIALDNALATWCDPRWHGSVLTLELKNNSRFHTIRLHHKCRIGQMIFHKSEPVPENRSYAVRGRYNNDAQAQEVK